ncbi:MAG: hypothetical protein AAFO07_08455 [Bacteroidota bacterium]
MKLQSVLTVFAMGIFLFTACELTQEPSEMVPKQSIDLVTPIEAFPEVEENQILYPKQFTPIKEEQSIIKRNLNAIEFRARRITRRRRLEEESSSSSSSSSSASSLYNKSIINCDSLKMGSTEDYMQNVMDSAFYARHGLDAKLDGNDRTYYLFVEDDKIFTFNLSNSSENLAMVLVSANITPPSETGTDTVIEQSTGLIAYSTSRATSSEKLGPVYLTPGSYILIVDSQEGKGSSFDLEVSCEEVDNTCDGLFHSGLLADDFESYDFSNLSQQTSFWEKFDASDSKDGSVRTFGSIYGKVLFMYRRNYGNVQGPQQDLLLNLGERNSGEFALEFDLGIFRRRSAYFNIQKVLQEQNIGNEVGAEFFFEGDGTAYAQVGGETLDFTYRNGYWERIRLQWNFSDGKTTLFINDEEKVSFDITDTNEGTDGTQAFEGVNFYPAFSNSKFVMDNICFSGSN